MKHLGLEAGNPSFGATQPLDSLPARAWKRARRPRELRDRTDKDRSGRRRTWPRSGAPGCSAPAAEQGNRAFPQTWAPTPGACCLPSPAAPSAQGPHP